MDVPNQKDHVAGGHPAGEEPQLVIRRVLPESSRIMDNFLGGVYILPAELLR